MLDATQTVLTVGMPTLAVLVGILVNDARLNDYGRRFDGLRGYIDRRFDGLQDVLDARFAEQKAELLRVERVMDARLRHLEESRWNLPVPANPSRRSTLHLIPSTPSAS